MKNKSFLIGIMLFLVTNIFIGQSQAQSEELNLPLRAAQFKLNRLAANQSADQAVFSIDQPNLILVEMISNNQNIQTSITTPSGRILTPANIAANGGEFLLTNAGVTELNPLILPSLTGNFHYIYSIPIQESGSYAVNFQAPAGLTTEVPILTEVTWDSPIAAKLIATEDEVTAGSGAVFTALLFNGSQPITGANVEISIRDQAGSTTPLNLLDNGSNADDRAGDGLYSGEFTPPAAGQYSIIAGMTGTVGGISFRRNSAARLTVLPGTGKLTGVVTDQGKDDNFDGLIDRVSLNIGTQIAAAGNYQVFVHLKTATNKPIVGSGTAQIAAGSGLIVVDMPAENFRESGENGPYAIELIELDILEATAGSRTVDRLRDLGQTQNYAIGQFQRKPLILTGVVSEQGFDDNGNGKFDRLRVTVQVDVLNAGFYQWNMKVSDQNGQKIDFAVGQGFLAAGLSDIVTTFNGSTIGLTGIHGPYLINDLLLFGSKSLVASEIGQTRAYRSGQFENGRSEDITPPVLIVALSPNSLFPPNHRMVPITATITVSDDTDQQPTVKLLSIESSEPDGGTGQGDQPNDIQNAEFGTDDRGFSVRAERRGSGTGRIYTVKYEARDATGNAVIVTKQVVVPHDRGN